MGNPSPDTLLGWHTSRARCHYCAEPGSKQKLTRDHIVPRARSGRTNWDNLVWACRECNWLKGHSLPTCRCDHCIMAILLHLDYIRGYEGSTRHRLLGQLEELDPFYERTERWLLLSPPRE